MNNINQILPRLMGQLKSQNMNGYNFVNNLIKNGGDPNAVVKQMMGKMNPQLKQQVLNQAKNYGCPDKFLSQLQNMK